MELRAFILAVVFAAAPHQTTVCEHCAERLAIESGEDGLYLCASCRKEHDRATEEENGSRCVDREAMLALVL